LDSYGFNLKNLAKDFNYGLIIGLTIDLAIDIAIVLTLGLEEKIAINLAQDDSLLKKLFFKLVVTIMETIVI
jgi:hypothetical protein